MAQLMLKFRTCSVSQTQVQDPGFESTLQRLLIDNHNAQTPVWCCCRPFPLPLSVVRGPSLYLRRFPGTDDKHHEDCIFSDPTRTSTHAAAHKPGITPLDEGPFAFRLSLESDVFPLRTELRDASTPVSSPVARAPHRTEKPTVSHGRVTLLGVFQHLVEQAGIHRWRPAFKGRTTYTVINRLAAAANECNVLRSRSLAELILWPSGGVSFQIATQHFARSPIRSANGRSESLVLGELRSALPDNDSGGRLIKLAGMAPTFICTPDAWERFSRSHPISLSFNDDGLPKHTVLCLMTVRLVYSNDPRPRSRFQVETLAPMAFSPDFIPVDSSYEKTCANYLVANGRVFTKPIRFTEADEMKPDFVLHDTVPPTYCEVWGLTTPEYLARMEEKRRLCRAQSIPLWEWNATTGESLPLLPPVSAW